MQVHGEPFPGAQQEQPAGGLYPVGSAPRRLLLARLQYARALTGERARALADRALVDYFRDADPVVAEAYDAARRGGW